MTIQVLEELDTLHLQAKDECPNCHCGTLEQNKDTKELVCRGKCGCIFRVDPIA